MRLLALLASVLAIAPAAQGPGVDQLSWMAGCWRMESGNRVADEVWMAPSGGAMLGMSRTVTGGRTSAHEFMQIREQDGAVVFIARPSGQAETTFRLKSSGPREVTFENPAHDFPQRVMYRMKGDTLVAGIEGTENGKARGVVFSMRRVACP
jgi:hypothetical protein